MITQTCASLSNWALSSMLGLLEQGAPKACHRVFPSAGPYSRLPVDLLNTAKESLTIWKNCVGPGAPLGTATAAWMANPWKPVPTPRMFSPEFAERTEETASADDP